LESAWYDGDKIKLSRDRVDRLGFFTEVNIDTQEVPPPPTKSTSPSLSPKSQRAACRSARVSRLLKK